MTVISLIYTQNSIGKLVEVNSMVTIRIGRLVLRELEDADWKAVHEYSSDSEVVRYMSWGPNTEEEDKSFILRAIAYQREQPRRNYALAMVLKANDILIGGCGLHISNLDNREAWLGYCLNRHFWRYGYATEAAGALLAFGFEELNLHRIFATCDPANIASAHVMEKIGMQREGHLRQHMWEKGRWRDSLLYAVLESERQKPKIEYNVAG